MKTILAENLELSRIIHGHWRLAEWNKSPQELLQLTEEISALGITTFDHADIYGDYASEQLFGQALALKKELRNKIQLITKCGIKLISKKYPQRKIKYYDYSYDHIVDSVNRSLSNLNTDYIDLLLLHRPAPFFDPEEVNRAFNYLKSEGKVLHFGVSNFNPDEFEMLSSFVDQKLVTNQVEISPYCLENFENGNMNYFLKKRIKPMAWSPLAGGKLLNPNDKKSEAIFKALIEVAKELNITSISKVIFAWLVNHPAKILPVVGSGKIERIQYAIDALDVNMSTEQWYKIYTASLGEEVP